MKQPESILRPVKRIRGGVRLPHLKSTAEIETVTMTPEKVYIPMSQHIGAPCEPTVKKGDKVFVGTKIGEAPSFVSAPIHASVSGTVSDITDRLQDGKIVKFIEIESDGEMKADENLKPFPINNAQDLSTAAKLCGLVGLGGAGFPTHVKLSPPKDTVIDTLIVNAAECEPYITSDYRECMENSNNVMECIYLIKEKLGLQRVVICVESNKRKAIEKLMAIAADKRDVDDEIKLMKLPTEYPQGAEKVIIYSATGRILPAGKLPSDIGCIVMNITSLGTLYNFIINGMPLTSKRVTVEGTAVKNPMNVRVPIGTKISDLLEFTGGVSEDCERIITGGPMMGYPVADTDAVIEKRTNAVLVLKSEIPAKSTPCIRCGRCAASCPMRLYPSRVETANRLGDTNMYDKLNVLQCMECGSCSFVCPAKRPLTQVMRVAKAALRRKG